MRNTMIAYHTRSIADLSPFERARIIGVPAGTLPPGCVRADTVNLAGLVRAEPLDPSLIRVGPPPCCATVLSTVTVDARPGFAPRTVRRFDPADLDFHP